MATDKKGYGKGRKTDKPKSPVDEFDSKLKETYTVVSTSRSSNCRII